MHPLQTFLESPLSREELDEQIEALSRLDFLREKFDNLEDWLSLEALKELQVARCFVSTTLRSQRSIENWECAQKLVYEWIDKDFLPHSEEALCELHTKLIGGTTQSAYRSCDIYTLNNRHPRPEELRELMSAFFSFLQTSESTHCVSFAAKVRQWLVSIHPFNDANGRVSQLLADFYLLRKGYLPQSFSHLGGGMVIGIPGQKVYMTPHRAFVMFTQSVIHSYELVMKDTAFA